MSHSSSRFIIFVRHNLNRGWLSSVNVISAANFSEYGVVATGQTSFNESKNIGAADWAAQGSVRGGRSIRKALVADSDPDRERGSA